MGAGAGAGTGAAAGAGAGAGAGEGAGAGAAAGGPKRPSRSSEAAGAGAGAAAGAGAGTAGFEAARLGGSALSSLTRRYSAMASCTSSLTASSVSTPDAPEMTASSTFCTITPCSEAHWVARSRATSSASSSSADSAAWIISLSIVAMLLAISSVEGAREPLDAVAAAGEGAGAASLYEVRRPVLPVPADGALESWCGAGVNTGGRLSSYCLGNLTPLAARLW
mmetsp:Transcript_8571/g.26927  ORF Transcript_8571/g.26927 Transcript_8571/m.26927 type:complete len:223 (-) Transcript_8571:520-1188(-)